jgi:hypothetical protein
MKGIYRVKCRKGDFEVEVESSEKAFVSQILRQVDPAILLGAAKDMGEKTLPAPKKDKQPRKRSSDIDVTAICTAIKNSENQPRIQEHILNQTNQLGRVLLVFEFCHQAGNTSISTGDVQRITDNLGIRVSSSNVAKVINKHPKFFVATKKRKQGARTPYKLSRAGKLAFSKISSGQKVKP